MIPRIGDDKRVAAIHGWSEQQCWMEEKPMAATLTPKVVWPENPRRLQPTDFGITVPTGLSDVHLREPNFVEVAVMATKSKEQGVGKGSALSRVNGLVTRDIAVTFANPEQQWKELTGSKTGTGKFQFQGGEVFLELQLAIYVLQYFKPEPKDKLSKQIFAEVYSHELLHVYDEVTLLQSLPDDVKGDGEISKVLADPLTFGTSAQGMAVAAAEFQEYIRNRIATKIVNDYWAAKTTERKDRRDSPEEYSKVQDRIATLRTKQINR